VIEKNLFQKQDKIEKMRQNMGVVMLSISIKDNEICMLGIIGIKKILWNR
jgi:hypothetical protein